MGAPCLRAVRTTPAVPAGEAGPSAELPAGPPAGPRTGPWATGAGGASCRGRKGSPTVVLAGIADQPWRSRRADGGPCGRAQPGYARRRIEPGREGEEGVGAEVVVDDVRASGWEGAIAVATITIKTRRSDCGLSQSPVAAAARRQAPHRAAARSAQAHTRTTYQQHGPAPADPRAAPRKILFGLRTRGLASPLRRATPHATPVWRG